MSNSTRPPIGDFRSAPGNEARRKDPVDPKAQTRSEMARPAAPAPTFMPAKPPAAKPAAPPAEDAGDDGGAPDEPEIQLTPKEAYEKRLEEAKIPLTEALSIFDAVMSKGYYEEYVELRGTRVVLRTRLYEDHLRVQTALELQRPGLVLTQEDLITRYNLAASLYEFRGEPLPHTNDKDFDAVMTLLQKLPAPLYSLLAQKLAVFDRKVMLVFSDGATDSF